MSATIAESVLSPASEEEAAALIADAAKAKRPLGIAGGGTRSGLGRPTEPAETLTSAKLSGIRFYEPAELVIGAGAGTPLRDVEAALAENGQMLAFEPMDHRALYGGTGGPTIGGVAAVNASGPRRIRVGAARDALLGVRFVNGSGEIIKSGGRVMKNVTGLDLVKLLCGSHGTLGFLTEVTFKVLPQPEHATTLVLEGLGDAQATDALSAALGSPFEPSGAAHLPAAIGAAARTLIRLEGFANSVAYRVAALRQTLARWGEVGTIEGDEAARLWSDIRDAAPLAAPADRAIWRVSTVPGRAPAFVSAVIAALPDARWYYDWGGGLVWLAVGAAGDAGASVIRGALKTGHATLVRAPDSVRRAVPVFQPQAAPLAKLSAGIKQSFDPSGVFAPGRIYDGL